MSTWATCDECGAKDDANYGKGPVLYAGAVVQLRGSNSGGEDIVATFDLCETCKDKLLEAFPSLKKLFTERERDR